VPQAVLSISPGSLPGLVVIVSLRPTPRSECFLALPQGPAGEAEMVAWPQPAHALVMVTDPLALCPVSRGG
jgi:hypothetical protein